MTAFQDEYDRYLSMYMQMHEEDPNVFVGKSTRKHSEDIKKLIQETNSTDLMDYGCGKGRQYLENKLHEDWGVSCPYLYDPAYKNHAVLPPKNTRFHGVICTDVLEHVPEDSIDRVLKEIFSYADRFVFLNVSTRPAGRKLPNGENAHCTVKPHQWWATKVSRHFDAIFDRPLYYKKFVVHLESTGKPNERTVTRYAL